MENEKGFTLIEVVASIVILTLLLTSFLSLLLVAAKSTQVSKEIIDYTLVAQTEVEKVYQAAQNASKSDDQTILVADLDYRLSVDQGSRVIYEKTTEQAFIQLTLSDYEDNSVLNETLSGLKVEVLSLEDSSEGAQMESIIEWGKNHE